MNLWIKDKISRIVGIVFYPIWIIPKQKYKASFNIDDIENSERLVIVRRSLRSKKFTFDKFGSVREDALINGLEDVPGLSLNLLGGLFKPSQIAYVPSKRAGKEWQGTERNLWFKYIKYVSYKFRSVPIYFFIENVHKISFPYSRPTDSKFKSFIQKYSPPHTTANNQAHVYGASIIKHSPAKLNYWHVEFTLLDIESRYSGSETTIVRNNIKTYSNNPEMKTDITKQKWTNQASYYALNEILVNSAIEHVKSNDWTSISEAIYMSN